MGEVTGGALRLDARRPLPLPLALALALASGPVMDAAFPDRDWWPLILPGVALVLVALIGRTLPQAFLVGFVAGLSFYLLHIQWATLFLGPVPWAALSTLQSLFVGAGAVLIALAYRVVPRAFPTVLGRLVVLPVVVAGLWILREGIASTWPYGGFAWGRVALSQSQSPIAPLFAWVGVAGVSFLVVVLVAMAVEAVRMPGVSALPRTTAVVALAALLCAVPAYTTPTTGELRVAAVQGNAKAGYFDVRELGDNLDDQVEATRPVYDEAVDVVLWPEGGSDLDPLRSDYAERVFDFVAENADAPLIAGTITQRGERFFNTSLLWRAGEGAVDYYDKKHPVPFGEYVPDREFWSMFAPDLIGLIQREYTPGTRDAVFDLGGGVRVGVNICFDIVDDLLIGDSVREGAQVIFAQSNNADFGRTDESVQQLAIARARAIETGRTVVNISTVGTSAIILPSGRTLEQLTPFEAGAMIADVPLATGFTPAVLFGKQLEIALSALGLAGLAIALLTRPRARRG